MFLYPTIVIQERRFYPIFTTFMVVCFVQLSLSFANTGQIPGTAGLVLNTYRVRPSIVSLH